ncbi:hypothetical protein [Nocardioides sp. SYSU D00038]|uniref:hypothetical protein n=1 Tax=Nocardioides sp. SYSU D00038 TaxID=2812554 RepID=UPI001967E45F|nr:hypothetical protein [Nocardioides sp. SYSU D00038]
MQLRRSLALSTGALLATLALSSCGFDLGTDQPYTPGAGVNERGEAVDVLSAMIVAGRDDAGTFIAGLANGDPESEDSLEQLAGGDDATLETAEFEPIEVGPGGYVSLADEGGIQVTGDFTVGQVVPVVLTFASGETFELRAPVVRACHEYADVELPAAGAKDEEPGEAYSCEFAEGEGH